jgi:hypothetical protein
MVLDIIFILVLGMFSTLQEIEVLGIEFSRDNLTEVIKVWTFPP